MPSAFPPDQSPSLRDSVAVAIGGMLYLSESEAPLELLDWPSVTSLDALQQRIEKRMAVPVAEQAVISADEFLAGIRQMADPADGVMLDYVKQYEALFELLRNGADEMVIVRAGKIDVHIIIAAFGKGEPAIIHTTAVET